MGTEAESYEYSFTLVLVPTDEVGYVAMCPSFPGLLIEGCTFEEAQARAEDLIRQHIQGLHQNRFAVPSDISIILEPVKKRIRVTVPFD